MHTITTLIAIFVIVTAIALLTSGGLTANAEAVKTKIKHHKRSSTRGTTGGGSTGTITTGGSTGTSTTGGPGSLSKFISCIRGAASSSTALGSTATGKVFGKLTRSEVTNCYDTVYGGTGSSGIGGSSGTRSSSVSGAGSSGGGSFPLTGPTGGTP